MGPDFGERQYEFAVNFEISTNLSGLLVGGVPGIPTTNEEAKKGYDAIFNLGTGYLYHLQYKIPTFASRRTPKNPAVWASHGGPYYRFSLLADSKGTCSQHLRLEQLRATEPGVFYCAPEFYLEADFWNYAGSSSVFSHSALIDLADVPLPTPTAPHSISYDPTGLVQVWSPAGRRSRRDRSPESRREPQIRDLTPPAFRRLLLDLVDALAADASIATRIPRADATSGLRTSIIDIRAPRPPRGQGERAPAWGDEEEAYEAFAEVPVDQDQDEAIQLIADLDDASVVLTASRIAALDFGLTMIVEPA